MPAPQPVQQVVTMQQQTRLVGYEPKYEYVDVSLIERAQEAHTCMQVVAARFRARLYSRFVAS